GGSREMRRTPRGAQWYANISEQPVGTGVRYIGVKPLRGVAIQCPSIQSTIPSTGSTALRKLVLSRSRWTIPKPSAQCSKMPMITSGSPKERENEQQDAGQTQGSRVWDTTPMKPSTARLTTYRSRGAARHQP